MKLKLTATINLADFNPKDINYVKRVIKERLLGEQEPINDPKNEDSLNNIDWEIENIKVI